MLDRILQFAQDNFDSAVQEVRPLGQWKGYTVYEPVGDAIFLTGFPTYVLVRENQSMRLTDGDESLDILGDILGETYANY